MGMKPPPPNSMKRGGSPLPSSKGVLDIRNSSRSESTVYLSRRGINAFNFFLQPDAYLSLFKIEATPAEGKSVNSAGRAWAPYPEHQQRRLARLDFAQRPATP